MRRLSLVRAAPQVLQHYGEVTHQTVEDVASALESLFWIERSGETSPAWARTLERLFALWCEQSGVVPVARAQPLVRDQDRPTVAGLRRTVANELGFAGADVELAVTDYVAAVRAGLAGRRRRRAEQILMRVLYQPAAHALCVQSAHVALARAVLYRVLEDKQLADERISGSPLDLALQRAQRRLVGSSTTPAIQLLEDMRRDSESFLPLLYGLRELDWWLIPTPRDDSQQQLFHEYLGAVEVAMQRLLRGLDGYDFAAVDHDVWKNVYQYHLPWEERQRLGSFYTPDALVDLTLDAAGWREDGDLDIDRLTIADISCGSGAFLVEALRRRRIAMQRRTSNRLGAQPTPTQLDELMAGIVGFDIHPFATFLASINLVFQIIDLYDNVRHRHPEYSLPLNVFTVDSLEDEGAHPRQAALQADLPDDIRIRHTEQEIERYRRLRGASFDVIVGNPPWGGVLKGKLSPLNDAQKRAEYRSVDRYESATGKFDIYVLFVERCIRWLKAGGRYALVVPNTYLDKDFARGLRKLLTESAPPQLIVDFGPYGDLFFGAMNTPSVLAGVRGTKAADVDVVVLSSNLVITESDRQARQFEVTNAAAAAIAGGSSPVGVTHFTEAANALSNSGAPWFLDPLAPRRATVSTSGDLSAGRVFEPAQGVTPAGEGVLALLRVTVAEAQHLALEDDITHPAVGGIDVQRWALASADKMMLYPYVLNPHDGNWNPAFTVNPGQAGEWDALDPRPRGRAEETLAAGLHDNEARERLIARRIAEGECPYPNAARYLIQHYERLAGRRNKGRPIGDFGRRWYEFLWPRDPRIMLARPKIIARRYAQWPTYALDEHGVIPSDKCMALWRPTSAGSGQLGDLTQALRSTLGRAVTEREVLTFALAFLNSSVSAFLLRVGRKQTAKGSWTVSEDATAWIPIVVDPAGSAGLLSDAKACVRQAQAGHVDPSLEADLDGQVLDSLRLDAATRGEIKAWAREHRPITNRA
jgi:hypothetical protein